MTTPEPKRSGLSAVNAAGKCATSGSAAEPVDHVSAEPGCPSARPTVMKQPSRESIHRRNTECEVYDDGTNTFFW